MVSWRVLLMQTKMGGEGSHLDLQFMLQLEGLLMPDNQWSSISVIGFPLKESLTSLYISWGKCKRVWEAGAAGVHLPALATKGMHPTLAECEPLEEVSTGCLVVVNEVDGRNRCWGVNEDWVVGWKRTLQVSASPQETSHLRLRPHRKKTRVLSFHCSLSRLCFPSVWRLQQTVATREDGT